MVSPNYYVPKEYVGKQIEIIAFECNEGWYNGETSKQSPMIDGDTELTDK